MRILVTNDDGINADGLRVLEEIARDVAGPDGEVWTVAPAFEQSGVAHCINYVHPTLMTQMSEHRYAAEGSPADCVLAGVHVVLEGRRPDLILSGVNRGNNSAENALYSGTLGGAIEGALQGIPAIAMSQYFGPANKDLDDPFEAARQTGADVIRRILSANTPEQADYRLFYNVNFPPVAAAGVQGIQALRQGRRAGVHFKAEAQDAPNGRRYLWMRGGNQHVALPQDTDAGANMAGYISVTPMRADLTAHDALDALGDAFA